MKKDSKKEEPVSVEEEKIFVSLRAGEWGEFIGQINIPSFIVISSH